MKKCESCKHFRPAAVSGQFERALCVSTAVINTQPYNKRRGQLPVLTARDICDKEGDGHFVHFAAMEVEDRGYTPADQETRQMFREACERVNL